MKKWHDYLDYARRAYHNTLFNVEITDKFVFPLMRTFRLMLIGYMSILKNTMCLFMHGCLFMTNHVHLLMTPKTKDGISKLMQSLGRRYVRYFNYRINGVWPYVVHYVNCKACPFIRVCV